jgi:hypothetical protein
VSSLQTLSEKAFHPSTKGFGRVVMLIELQADTSRRNGQSFSYFNPSSLQVLKRGSQLGIKEGQKLHLN